MLPWVHEVREENAEGGWLEAVLVLLRGWTLIDSDDRNIRGVVDKPIVKHLHDIKLKLGANHYRLCCVSWRSNRSLWAACKAHQN